jgi:hypothetical protein
LPAADVQHSVRTAARDFEQALPPARRKQLGQYFTGLPLGKLLAHLALDADTASVLDPMAGHGDLLDATWEAASERGIALQHLHGIEIDPATASTCRDRLGCLTSAGDAPSLHILAGDAFDSASARALPLRAYDLVITNPPYVRYQSRNGNGTGDGDIRAGLGAVIESHLSGADAVVWRTLAENYSGLADLSVPAWLLAATMVRPGGRLALVVPATWRSRDYADVIRYLLLRCFLIECIVEDQQPGWFSDALVRTHIIVARRLSPAEIARPITKRVRLPAPLWLQAAPAAAAGGSLVGAACSERAPEAAFAAWVHGGCTGKKTGIKARRFDLEGEWTALEKRIARRPWYQVLEPGIRGLPLFAGAAPRSGPALPEAFADLIDGGNGPFLSLEDAGIAVGQGLRTGCNDFFYVTACHAAGPNEFLVEASPLLGGHRFAVLAAALRPALRRQAELASVEKGQAPDSRVLDLRSWILPEDRPAVHDAAAAYAASGETPPQVMPDELAAYVRNAAETAAGSGSAAKLIPALSAVCTNARLARGGRVTPRFWYMLPDFAPRHLPLAFVPRINQGLPRIEANLDPPLLVDANFSTFWAQSGAWTALALKALFCSIWCRAMMEALGTPMGGGALKLEATHLRHMPLPVLAGSAREELDRIGRRLSSDPCAGRHDADRLVLGALAASRSPDKAVARLATNIEQRALALAAARQRFAS